MVTLRLQRLLERSSFTQNRATSNPVKAVHIPSFICFRALNKSRVSKGQGLLGVFLKSMKRNQQTSRDTAIPSCSSPVESLHFKMLLELQKGWPATPFVIPSSNASALMHVLTQVKILREYIKTQSHQPMPQGSKTQVVMS